MATAMLKVRSIFNMAQDGVVASKLCDMLTPIQNDTKEDDFWDAFLNHVQKSMIFYKAEVVVERIMELIATFATYPSVIKSKNKEKVDEDSELSEDEAMDPFLVKLLNFLLENHNAKDKGVRFRCCQLINKLLYHLGDEATIDEDISDAIYECMMIRIKDKFPTIRIQAVLALVRLQDPEDEECPVIDAFLHSLETDINPVVRRNILTHIALSRKTLPYVLGRIRDVNEQNRKAAYLVLAEKVSIRALTIAQRINILTTGLNDRTGMVNNACVNLLKAWLRSYEHDVIKLLQAIDTEGSPDCSKLVLEAVLKDASIEKMKEHVEALLSLAQSSDGIVKMIDPALLTPENIFYWLGVSKHLKNLGEEGEVLLQTILPELTNFCEYIRTFAEKSFIDSAILTAFEGKEGQPEFILEYLLNIAGLLDLSDEVGRKNLQTLVHDLLVTETVPVSIVTVLVARYIDVEKNEEKFIQGLAETISDIRQPLTQVVTTAMKEESRRIELHVARITVNLNECKENLDEAIKTERFQEAALLKDQIAELCEQKESLLIQKSKHEEYKQPQRIERDDPETLLKCLTVASSLLYQVKHKGLRPTLITLRDELIFEGVKNEDPFIRNEAVKCLGHLSLLNKDFACQHLVLFLQVAQVDQELVQITAVQIIFDLFMMYGLQTFDVDGNESKLKAGKNEADESKDAEMLDDNDTERTFVEETPPEELEKDESDEKKTNAAERVLEILLMFLESESADLRTTVAEGMAKLLKSGRIVSTMILTRLIILWYNPITEDDIKLRHCLGVFLPVFSFENRNNQEIIEQCFLPVLKTLFNAPSTSPLSKINVSNVIELLLQLTDVQNLAQTPDKTGSSDYNHFETYVHDSIATKLANEIITEPEDPDVKLLCKTLNQLNICPRNGTVIQDLLELNIQMMEALEGNKTAKKMIQKFHTQIQEMFVHQDATVGQSDITTSSNHDRIEEITNCENKENNGEEQFNNDENTIIGNTDEDTTLTDPIKKQIDNSAKKHKLSLSSEKIRSKKSKMNSTTASIDFDVNHDSTIKTTTEEESEIEMFA